MSKKRAASADRLNSLGLPNNVMHIPELADLLGRSEGAVRQLVWRRLIPYRRVAGRIVFLRDEIEQFIREQSEGVRPEEIQVSA